MAGKFGIHALHGTRTCCRLGLARRTNRRYAKAGGRSFVGPPPSGRVGAGCFSARGVGTGVEPVTARFCVWCSTFELTSLDTAIGQKPFAEHAPPTASTRGQGDERRWPRPHHRFQRDAGGSRTHLHRVAAGRRAVWLQRHDFYSQSSIRVDSFCFPASRNSFQTRFAPFRGSLTSCVRRMSIVIVSPPGVLA
jgi:hypothetical protein